MKKKILPLLLCSALYFPSNAQFLNSSIPDIQSPVPTGLMYDSKDMNAYSVSGLDFDDQTSSLDVYCWSLGGFGWIRKRNGDPNTVLDQGYIATPYSDAGPGDIAIIRGRIREGEPIYNMIVYAYYNASGTYLDFYKCETVGVTLVLHKQLSTAATTRVSLDAHELSLFAVAWDNVDGLIHTVAGSTGAASGIVTIGCENYIAVPPIQSAITPDIAFSHPQGGDIELHYVCLSSDRQTAVKLRKEYDYLLPNCGVTTPGNIEDVFTPGGTFSFYPKIDCPDHSIMFDDWAYVASEANPTPYSTDNKIHLVRNIPEYAASVQHSVLNDYPGLPMLYNVGLGLTGSQKPCVAYEPEGTSLKVLWHFSLKDFDSQLGYYDYIGLTMNEANEPTTNEYWVVDYAERPNDDFHAIALSTQNDMSEDAFATYFEALSGVPEKIFYKNIPWLPSSFKQQPTGIKKVGTTNIAIGGYPNPFTKGFTLTIDDQYVNAPLNVALSDINGRTIATFKGNIAAVNKGLASVAASLPKGIFLLNVQSEQLAINNTLKITKL